MDALAANLSRVRGRIASACDRAGRAREDVTLVAVTKTVDAEVARALVRLGAKDLGESRAQDGVPRTEALRDLPGLRWHFIGQLQRNKVRKVLPAFQVVHAVDSLSLARQIDQVAREIGWAGEVLVEVNVAGEAQKGGIEPGEGERFLGELINLPGLRVAGLMTMAPLDARPDEAREVFRILAGMREQLRKATGLSLPHLSMGMSRDFEVAVEEGATLVRVGTALFEGVG